LHASIHASDEVVVTVSTVGVEASLAGKCVTQVRGSILDHLSPYIAMGIADRQLTVEEIAHAYVGPSRPVDRSMSAVAGGEIGNATANVVRVLQAVQERGHAG
jgi:hypothetical protein